MLCPTSVPSVLKENKGLIHVPVGFVCMDLLSGAERVDTPMTLLYNALDPQATFDVDFLQTLLSEKLSFSRINELAATPRKALLMPLISRRRRTHIWVIRWLLVFSFALTAGFLLPDQILNQFGPTACAAAVFTVNSLGDTPDAVTGNGTCADSTGACTLRAAIQEANSLAGDDTINFSVTGTINLDSALPNIASNMIINGPGANTLTIQRSTAGGTPNFRIFTTNSGTVITISGLTVTNGRTADGAPGGGFTPGYGGQGDNGGGILNSGALTLTDVVVTGNRTGDGGAGTSGTGGFGGFGGGIFSSGPLTMTNGTVSNNTAGNGAVGFFGGSGGRGGGIYRFSGPFSALIPPIGQLIR